MNYEKGPLFIHLDITRRCNLKCVHCRNLDESEDELSLESFKVFIDDALNYFPNFKQVFIGGGEPLCRKEDLFELISYCLDRGLKVSLNTNATLIKQEDLEGLKNISAFQVSLDGSNAETHDFIRGVKGSFDKAVENIKLLKSKGFYVCVRMTLFELNYFEVFELLDLCRELNVDAFSWFRVLPSGKGKEIQEVAIDPKSYFIIMKELTRLKYELQNEIKIVSSEPTKIFLDKNLLNEIKKKYGEDVLTGCMPGSVELFMDSFGNFYPCTMLQDFRLGNIRKDNLKKIWENSEILNDLRNKQKLKGCCGECEIKNLCGGCRAAAYGKTGNLYEEDSYCPKKFSKKEFNNKIQLSSPCQIH